MYAKLKRGESVVTQAGRSITPEAVLGPPKKGKKVWDKHINQAKC